MAPTRTQTMDTLEAGPRRKGKIEEALEKMAHLNSSVETMEAPMDPDVQATVSDFLDFTEYLPSDMRRSLTLIGNLDRRSVKASDAVNSLTKTYGKLPNLPARGKPEPAAMRADISEHLVDGVCARTLSYSEAARMADNAQRHYKRAQAILTKLRDMQETYPESRAASPELQKKSPVVKKITLINRGRAGESSSRQIRKHRAPRITVPGEVLAPYELDYESYGSETDSESDQEQTLRKNVAPASRAGIKINVQPKLQKEKAARPPRAAGGSGSNVHSSVAGISTSNALAKLQPPPKDALIGSEEAPWLQLTAYELARLRKRMKKNAVWVPSDTMINRELKLLRRGADEYYAAKEQAEAAGLPFDQPIPIPITGKSATAVGVITDAAQSPVESVGSARAASLDDAKKLKKENEAKEAAQQAASEAEESARKMMEAAKAVKDLFKPEADSEQGAARSAKKLPIKKRKRDDLPESTANTGENGGEEAQKNGKPVAKKAKPNNGPASPSSTTATASAPRAANTSAPVPIQVPTPADSTSGLSASVPSPPKSTTPILPPTADRASRRSAPARKDVPVQEEILEESKKELLKKEAATRETKKPERANVARARQPSLPSLSPTPDLSNAEALALALAPRRPTSSRGREKTANAESSIPMSATATIDRPRRSSTARNTPAPEVRQGNKRTKKPAPGVVTASVEGSAAVSIGKRGAAPKKRAGAKKEKKDGREGSLVMEEVDDEGKAIDPNEPRYCICNRVSFGQMIGCENTECEREWFHFECVGLVESPARTTKWYCPDCRVALGIGEKGEVNARGKRK